MDDFDPLQIKIKDGSVDATLPVISNPTSTGERLGIYEVPGLGYYVYLGQYDGDIRQGNGISMAFDYTEGLDRVITCEYAVGEWKEDKPNGACTQYAGAYLSDTEFLYDVLIEGTVVDGIYNGEFSYLFSDEDQKFYGEYENGVVKVLDEVDPNGDPSYVYLYNEDKTEWYYFDDVSQINPKSHDGVYGYAYTEN